VKKEQLLFLVGGFAFGVLVGFGLFQVYNDQPNLAAGGAAAQNMASPAGPRAPGQGAAAQGGGGGGAAPMVSEINELKRRLEANPKDVVAATRLGGMYYDVGMWEQALQFYDIALAIDPNDANVLTDSGNVYRELGQHARALDSFRRAHELDPKHWQSLFNTVVVATFDLQQMELADAAMAKLDQFDPKPVQLPALKQAVAEFRTGEVDSAGSQ
jgi:tetratricopeptide (TPR) repeat protein